MTMKIKKYRCICCGFYTMTDDPFDICHVCGWEGSNISIDSRELAAELEKAKSNFYKYGYVEPSLKFCGRCAEKYERVSDEHEYIEVKFDWPSLKDIQQKLREILNEKISAMAVSLWAEDILDYQKYCYSQIEGFYPMEARVETILKEIVYIGDEENGNLTQEDRKIVNNILELTML